MVSIVVRLFVLVVYSCLEVLLLLLSCYRYFDGHLTLLLLHLLLLMEGVGSGHRASLRLTLEVLKKGVKDIDRVRKGWEEMVFVR